MTLNSTVCDSSRGQRQRRGGSGHQDWQHEERTLVNSTTFHFTYLQSEPGLTMNPLSSSICLLNAAIIRYLVLGHFLVTAMSTVRSYKWEAEQSAILIKTTLPDRWFPQARRLKHKVYSRSQLRISEYNWPGECPESTCSTVEEETSASWTELAVPDLPSHHREPWKQIWGIEQYSQQGTLDCRAGTLERREAYWWTPCSFQVLPT